MWKLSFYQNMISFEGNKLGQHFIKRKKFYVRANMITGTQDMALL